MLTFIYEHTDMFTEKQLTTLKLTTEEVSLGEILPLFRDFLKGCGFIIDGDLVILNEDED